MTNKNHNGWDNYETWAIALWLDNEQGSQDYWLERAEAANDDVWTLSAELKDSHEEALPEIQGFAADLLNAAMSEVNWDEIARHYIEMVKENATT